ncbi:MAG: endo-1,4-beta-xylanase [Actinomycetota bacterium]
MDRRRFLTAAAAGLSVSALGAAVPTDAGGPLAGRAAKRGLAYGAAVTSDQLADQGFARVFARDAGMVVPEWETKRQAIEAAPGRLDFTAGDRLAGFARRHGQAFRGHTLVWHQSLPLWLGQALAERPEERLLTAYVEQVAKHFRGTAVSWDVVNEAVEPTEGGDGSLRPSPWLDAFGPAYVEMAFHAARAGDPEAMLVYNDYDLEAADQRQEDRRTAVLRLLESLRARAVPVDAVGLQAHLRAFGPPLDPKRLSAFLHEAAAMGLKIVVTELDVNDRGGPSGMAERDRAVADTARRFLDVVLDRPETVAVLSWGLSDRYSWLVREQPEARPLPLDRDLVRKPLWHAMARCFDSCPMRSAPVAARQ